MSDLQEQLAQLRRKIASIDKKYAENPPPRPGQGRFFIEQWMSGEVVETPFGQHFETEKLWERHRRHGSMDISDLAELPADLLAQLSEGEIPSSPPQRWAFLDTETTGLAGGTGTYAFLIGVGRITPEGFRLRQFFMRDYREEPSLLWGLTQHLAEFDVLVTYNGKVYDQPLLETRYRMCRAKPPFEKMRHLDLLYGARRLWKLRLESCRLVDLETQILGVERDGDLPGAMIPYVYFEFLRTQQAWRVVPIFHHNSIDILTLACLTAIVPQAFLAPDCLKHGADLLGMARWFQRTERGGQALEMMRRAVDLGLPDALLFRTMWDIAALEKKQGNPAGCLEVLADLIASPNPFRIQAYEELAKFHEHERKDYAIALEMVEAALSLADSEELRKREARLRRRLAQPKPQRLL